MCKEQGNRVHRFYERDQRGSGGILWRIADGVSDDDCFVCANVRGLREDVSAHPCEKSAQA
jgi:hypothetical protein